jgi:hypothetical protein
MTNSFDIVLDWKKRFKKEPWVDQYYNIQDELLPERDFNLRDKKAIVEEYDRIVKNFGKPEVEAQDPLRQQRFSTSNYKKTKTGGSTM